MKEKYNSEKDLGNAFDSFKMPLDSNAFDAFKTELDKEEKRRKFIWWKFYGGILMSIILLGFIVVGVIYLSDFEATTKLSSDNTTIDNSIIESGERKKQSKSLTDNESRKTDYTEELSMGLKKDEQQLSKSKLDRRISSVKQSTSQGDISLENDGTLNNANQVLRTGSFTLSNEALGQQDIITPIIPERNPSSSFSDNEKTGNMAELDLGIIQEIGAIQFLNILPLVELENQIRKRIQILNDRVSPAKERYKSHFYFHSGVGVSQDDNFGFSDPFFETLKPKEFLLYVSAAYQISDNTAIELGLIRKNISLGFSLKDFTYSQKVGNMLSILRARVINKIWSPSQKIRFHMTNGIAMVKASSNFNEGLDFSTTTSGMDVPSFLSSINLGWEGLYSGNHFMYSGGLSMDYKVSEVIELNVGAEYSLGFNPVMSATLTYVAGEGIFKQIETNNNASYGSIALGIKYRLRKL